MYLLSKTNRISIPNNNLEHLVEKSKTPHCFSPSMHPLARRVFEPYGSAQAKGSNHTLVYIPPLGTRIIYKHRILIISWAFAPTRSCHFKHHDSYFPCTFSRHAKVCLCTSRASGAGLCSSSGWWRGREYDILEAQFKYNHWVQSPSPLVP